VKKKLKRRSKRRDALFERHTPLAQHIAGVRLRRLPLHNQTDDVLTAALYGLYDATLRWEPERGAAFHTYAARRINGEITDRLRQLDWVHPRVRRRNPGFRMYRLPIGREGGVARGYTLEAPRGRQTLDAVDEREAFEALIRPLQRRERAVLRLKYARGMNLEEIGHAIQLSPSRVCQVHGEALARLRASLEKKGAS
jgi:RNA polymerase sigma factor for flagellar operon FliA